MQRFASRSAQLQNQQILPVPRAKCGGEPLNCDPSVRVRESMKLVESDPSLAEICRLVEGRRRFAGGAYGSSCPFCCKSKLSTRWTVARVTTAELSFRPQ